MHVPGESEQCYRENRRNNCHDETHIPAIMLDYIPCNYFLIGSDIVRKSNIVFVVPKDSCGL